MKAFFDKKGYLNIQVETLAEQIALNYVCKLDDLYKCETCGYPEYKIIFDERTTEERKADKE